MEKQQKDLLRNLITELRHTLLGWWDNEGRHHRGDLDRELDGYDFAALGDVLAREGRKIVIRVPKDQAATVVLATLELNPFFEGDWAEIVRLVYGDSKTVLEVALALNEANSSPLTNQEIEDLPFQPSA